MLLRLGQLPYSPPGCSGMMCGVTMLFLWWVLWSKSISSLIVLTVSRCRQLLPVVRSQLLEKSQLLYQQSQLKKLQKILFHTTFPSVSNVSSKPRHCSGPVAAVQPSWHGHGTTVAPTASALLPEQ